MAATQWTTLANPSYQNALAADIKAGMTVVVNFTIPILYRTETVPREVTLLSMNITSFTVKGATGTQGTHPWSMFYAYIEESST